MRARIATFSAAAASLLILAVSSAWSQDPDPCPTGTEPACAGQWSAPMNLWTWTAPNPACSPPVQPSCTCQNASTAGPCKEVAHTVLLVGLPAGAPFPWAVLFWRVGPQRPEQAWIWQPGTTNVNTVEVVDPTGPRCGVIFCGGHARFPDGRIVVVDGTRTCVVGSPSTQCPNDPLNDYATGDPHGTQEAWLFDPGLLTGPPATWQPWRRLQDLHDARWYPTVLAMANGDVLTGGGLTSSEACTGGNPDWADSSEWLPWNGGAFNYLTAQWQLGPGLPATTLSPNASFGTFPHLFLLANPTTNADVFLAAHDGVPYVSQPSFAFLNNEWAWLYSRTNPADIVPTANNPLFQRGDGTSAPVPGFADRYALVGGQRNNNDLTGIALVETIQSPQAGSTWSSTTYGSLNQRRLLNHIVVLPDGSLLTVGGMDREYRGSTPQYAFIPRFHAELLDPSFPGGFWQLMAPAAHRRPYHAGAILLPDGTVLVTGGEFDDPNYGSTTGFVPLGLTFQSDAEIFSPPYLFRGPRPSILSGPPTSPPTPYSTPGGAPSVFNVDVMYPEGTSVTGFVLIRPDSATHGVNFEQRYVQLGFQPSTITAIGRGWVTQKFDVTAPMYDAGIPGTSHLAPPGFWMMFVVITQGGLLPGRIPSTAWMVRLQ